MVPATLCLYAHEKNGWHPMLCSHDRIYPDALAARPHLAQTGLRIGVIDARAIARWVRRMDDAYGGSGEADFFV